jgi:hypothetical protein
MTDHRTNDLPADSDDVLAAFHAEVVRLMSLSREAFAALAPDGLAPLVATIHVTASKVPAS